MSPSEYGWLQGWFFFFLSAAVSYYFYWRQKRRTNRGTSDDGLISIHVDSSEIPTTPSDDELISIHVESEIPTTPSDDTESSGGDEEARSPSNLSNPFAGEDVLALPWTSSCPDRKRCLSGSLKSSWMAAGNTSRLPRSPRRLPFRSFVPRSSREIPLEPADSSQHIQASTFDGLRLRRSRFLNVPEGPFAIGEEKRYRGIRYRPDRRKWVAEMRPRNSKNKCSFGDFRSALQAAFAIDAAFFYYDKEHLTNFLHSTPAMKAMLPRMPGGFNDKDELLFVKDKAKRLAMYAAENLEVDLNPKPSTKSTRST